MSEIELKAAGCPCEGNFAFGPVGPDPDAEANHTAWNIDCFNDDCLVEPHFEHPGPRAEAIALWNQRTPATPDAVIEPASNPCRLDAAVIERARVLLFNGGEDASLNLQGALHDLENRWKPDDGGVCARTIGRAIDQLEAFRRVIDALATTKEQS